MELPRLRRIRLAVRATLILGVAASLAANVLHARDNPISQAIAAWPPLALLLTVELISRVPVHRRSLAAARLAATATISGIAAWVSYWHMAGVASRYGETGASPYLLPLSVDGLIIVASISLVELGGRITTAETAAADLAAPPPAAPTAPTRPAAAPPAPAATPAPLAAPPPWAAPAFPLPAASPIPPRGNATEPAPHASGSDVSGRRPDTGSDTDPGPRPHSDPTPTPASRRPVSDPDPRTDTTETTEPDARPDTDPVTRPRPDHAPAPAPRRPLRDPNPRTDTTDPDVPAPTRPDTDGEAPTRPVRTPVPAGAGATAGLQARVAAPSAPLGRGLGGIAAATARQLDAEPAPTPTGSGSMREQVYALLDRDITANDTRRPTTIADDLLPQLGAADRSTIARYVRLWRDDVAAGRRNTNGRLRAVPPQTDRR